jgi:Domain of unknown function (DUF4440)
MKHRVTLVFLAFFFGLFLLSLTSAAKAQVGENSALFKTVMALDRQLFDEGFNQCKLDRFEALIPADVAFYHDKGGAQDRKEFVDGFRKNICANSEGKPLRTLVPGSTRIFPMTDNGVLYGAVQTGEHTFQMKGKSRDADGYTVAKFTHLWLLKNGRWQLQSALSFDHQQIAPGAGKPLAVKAKKEPEPYTIYDLTLLGHSLRLDYRAMLD